MIFSRGARTALAVVGVVGALGACAQPPPPPPHLELTYAHLAPIELDVARIEIVNEHQPTLRPPNVEHEFPVSPAAAALRWATDRLRAVGESGLARVIVREAGVVEVALEKSTGLKGVFTAEQTERYVAKLVVDIEIRSERGYKDAFVSAEATRSRTVPENITINQREKVFFDLTAALMNDINAELEALIAQHFGDYLR